MRLCEEWKAITGYEGLYDISNKGRVRSYKNGKWGIKDKPNILKGMMGKHYLTMVLCKDSIKTTHSVHELVAKAFIENPKGLKEINHIDGNKLNNAVDNLEWCTHKENMQHAGRHGLFANRQKTVICKETGEEFNSITSASKSVNGKQASLSSAMLYRNGHYKGHTFIFKEK